ncbi:unnamed protein product [Rhizophagus irregularis]|nr:unnamed protein product [Rhizophagus irregularis]
MTTYKRGPWNNFEIGNLITSMSKHGRHQRKLIEQEVGRTFIECVKKYNELLGVQNYRHRNHSRCIRHIRNIRQNNVVAAADNILTIPPVNISNQRHRNPIMEWSYILNDDSNS